MKSVLLLVVIGFALVSGNPNNARCNRQEGRFISDWSDCQAWFFCLNGEARPGRCEQGYLFDEIRQMCNHPNEVDCAVGRCPASGFFDLPMEGDCQSFIRCINGHATFHSCPDDMVFDANLRVCNQPDRYECDISWNCPLVTDPNNPVFIPSTGSCEEFFICINGDAIPRQCDEGVWWNQNLQVCDDPANVQCDVDMGGIPPGFCPPDVEFDMRPHPTDCQLFVMCISGEAHPGDCGEGLHFNPTTSQCDRQENVPCPNNRKMY